MRMLCLILLLFVCCVYAEVEVDSTLAEMESLRDKKAWNELVHALSQVPSPERNARWEALVVESSGEYLKDVAEADQGNLRAVVNELTKKYPLLSGKIAFRERFHMLMLDGFKRCYENTKGKEQQNCTDRLVGFVKTEMPDPSLVDRAADLVQPFGVEVFAVYAVGIEAIPGIQSCTQKKWKDSLLSVLESDRTEFLATARDLAENKCWTYVRADLKRALERKPASTLRNVCAILRAKKALSSTHLATCVKREPGF